MQTKETT